MCFLFLYVFFFKQKTAYEMRISDWSSDVCSSDLLKEPIMASSVAYILHLDRDKLLEFKKREPARLQYMPASFNPPDPLGIDLILDHDRAWFFDANSERNKVMRQALGAPTQRLGRPVWDEMS